MKRILFLFVLILLSSKGILAQTKVSGKILDQKKQPLPGVNVFIKDTYDGASTDANGNFSFTATDTGEVIIVCSFIGFEQIEKKVKLTSNDFTFNTSMKESLNELKVVTISAGTIEA